MIGYLVRRVTGTIPVIILISMLVFMLVQAAPGDPADMLLSDEATKEDLEEARKRWGLDQPIYIQYAKFLVLALQGDLGESFRYADPVIDLIIIRLPATAELAVFAILIAIIFGLPLGVWAGARPNSWVDNVGSFFGFFGISMPNFWFGIMLILVVSGVFNLLPSAGRDTYGIAGDPITGFYLLDSLLQLRDMGNSVIVIEHDEATIRAADHVIDLGPEGGHGGGEVIACGTPEEIAAEERSHTGRYLRSHL